MSQPATPSPEASHRERIISAAGEILDESGLNALSVTSVMRRAGISRTSFYRHFADIYDVVHALLDSVGRRLIAASGDWLRGATGTPGVVHGNLLTFAQAFRPVGPMLEAIAAAAVFDERIRALWDSLVQQFVDATEAAIRRDQATGAIRADIDAASTALALNLMGEKASLTLMGRGRAGTPGEYADLLTPIWIRALFGVVPG